MQPTIPCVGALVPDAAGRLLVVRRRHDPGAGLWSLPGGRVETGEAAAHAVRREVEEETGLVVEPVRKVGEVRLPAPGGGMYRVEDYTCRLLGGTLRAGDDAHEARWCTPDELTALPAVDGLLTTLRRWGVLDPDPTGRNAGEARYGGALLDVPGDPPSGEEDR